MTPGLRPAEPKASERKLVRYPVKIGFKDGSGKDENWITDTDDDVLVGGWGDCCRIGGIQQKNVAKAIVLLLNTHKPRIFLKVKGVSA